MHLSIIRITTLAFRLVPFKRPKVYKILHQKCCAGMLEEGQIAHVTWLYMIFIYRYIYIYYIILCMLSCEFDLNSLYVDLLHLWCNLGLTYPANAQHNDEACQKKTTILLCRYRQTIHLDQQFPLFFRGCMKFIHSTCEITSKVGNKTHRCRGFTYLPKRGLTAKWMLS